MNSSGSSPGSSQGGRPGPPRPHPEGEHEMENEPDGENPDSPQEGGDQEERNALSLPLFPAQLFFVDPQTGGWGSLPARLQTSLPNAATELLPLRYRRSLEAFHRRQQQPER